MICARCEGPRESDTHAYCRSCHAEYMRGWRASYAELSEEDKQKSRIRAHTNVLVRRGKLKRRPCRVCGGPAWAVHLNWTDPYAVVWLCRDHKDQKENT